LQNKIVIKGARVNNLKNISLEIPRDKLVIFTGVSGSGKSSLAFDTLFAEGHRRYVESLSSYARQFLGQMEKPDVDSIEGLSPSISIDQKTTSKNPRSTVGTITEIYDYLRLLYARVGVPHCPVCGDKIEHQTTDQIVENMINSDENSKIIILAPIIENRKGEFTRELELIKKKGYGKIRIDGYFHNLSEEIHIEKTKKHNIEVVVDRIIFKADFKGSLRTRLAEAVDSATKLTDGIVIANIENSDVIFSKNYACKKHKISAGELTPQMFSFNNPSGACKKCTGLGSIFKVDPEMIVPNKNLSISEGGIKCSGWAMEGNSVANMYFDALSKKYNFSLSSPISELSHEVLEIIFYGTKGEELNLIKKTKTQKTNYKASFEGIINNLERRFKETKSDWIKEEISSFMNTVTCDKCEGKKLNPISLGVTLDGVNISSFCEKSIKSTIEFIKNLNFKGTEKTISEPIIKEINERLSFLEKVGLEYLTLARSSGTLSGGESQRIRLATQIGSALTGVLYILDEPSIGLHQRDNQKLIETLKNLKNLGNSVIVVEHDEETMRAADLIVDIGPGAGVNGGKIVAVGTAKELEKNEFSLTGKYLSGSKSIEIPEQRRSGNGSFLEVIGANKNNLKNINVKIPLGTITCVTGVSGSGKSTLVNEIIYKNLAIKLNRTKGKMDKNVNFKGIELLDKVIDVNQAPIGRTPRSNPATYTGIFNDIRELFASTKEARIRAFGPGRFSFNVKGGRCEACQGDGILKIEMHFLPDIYVSCEVCGGKRYNRDTLEVKYKNKNIDEILKMTVDEALVFFENIEKVQRKLSILKRVGLGYIKLGQSATTLSGGEAQRIKIATELGKKSTGKTLYFLDEPTTGLHVSDVHKLVETLRMLVETGNTIVIIEHNLELLKTADYIIDLGPEGGEAGGEIVAEGVPEQICQNKNSYTGFYLSKCLK
jgi:excinuclease ABC subunit A